MGQPLVDQRSLSHSSNPAKASCYQNWREGEFTIMPENNSVLDAWDCVVISALAVTAVLVPYQVALISHPTPREVMMGKVIDAIFTIDIVLTFNVACIVEEKGQCVEIYEKNPCKIAK